MKKFLMATLATTAVATVAHAGSISFDTRFDYQSVNFDSASTAASANNSSNSHMYFKTGRLDLAGNLAEDTTYRLRFTYNGSSAPSTTVRDNVLSTTNYAYITQKLGSDLSLTLGKMSAEIGGFEGPTPSAELYLTSEGYTHKYGTTAMTSRAYGVGDAGILYMTGAKLEYAFMDQSLGLMILNPAQDETKVVSSNTGLTQTTSAWGAIYKGSFLEKSLGVLVSFHETPGTNNLLPAAPGNYTDTEKTDFMSVGLKWTASSYIVSGEYNTQTATYGTGGGSTDKLASTIVKAAYTGWEQWTPRLEYTATTESLQGGTSNTFSGYGAVAEFKPRKENNFRYHVAYQSITESPAAGSNMTRTEFVVGTRMMADFLK